VTGGEVTLSGVVEDRRARRDAEDCAYTVSGVRDVQNLLRVRDDDRDSRRNRFGRG
jgi:osmotically-inducible protein OsmY